MKTTAEQRLERILAMIPWIVAHNGPTVKATCERFGCTPSDLVRDIELLYVCGLHPFTPDLLIEAGITDGRVFVQYADYLSRPLRLTPAEGLALVASASTLLAAPGTDPDGPLARALAKLGSAIGSGDVEVDLGSADQGLLSLLQNAVNAPNQLQLTYYAYGRDETTVRNVEIGGVFSSGGAWYVAAFCHLANDERLFRVDRIVSVEMLTKPRVRPAVSLGSNDLRPGHGGDRFVLEVAADANWVREQYPVESSETMPTGRVRITLLVNEWPWLDRLLLRLGSTATVIAAPESWTGRHVSADKVLARYDIEL